MRAIRILCCLFTLLSGAIDSSIAAEPESVGPQTEARFPPLLVPDGFRATLFACDPLVEYPSVIALGPRPGSLFVAHDYTTGLGFEIVRRDEIRLLEDTDGDGYADKSTVFADGFNSIQGLEYRDGTVFAMHAPLLTALRDTDGDGRADERRDLLSGLGLKPEDNRTRLHCANGVVAGHDGWLYLAQGDNGIVLTRPEGDRLVVHGGAILRCRPDGRDLHVFASGLRNIYDVTLDDDLNVFVRDNENDGGTYMIRVCHSFFAADHGYPYLYYERPEEALAPLADLGRGSSAGVVCYRETAFPAEYCGNLFCCEWGRAVVHYELNATGSGFAETREIDFAAGAEDDPYGFKPTDAIVDRDGSLLVADWCDGQRPQRGRGRIYRIAHVGSEQAPKEIPATASIDDWIKRLDSPSYHVRVAAQLALQRTGDEGLEQLKSAMEQKRVAGLGRMHTVWIEANLRGSAYIDDLLSIASSDEDARVRVQAMRAIADLGDPQFVAHRLNTGRGDAELAARFADLADGQEPRVMREIVVALGRLRWRDAPAWLRDHLVDPDAALQHAAMQTLRRCDNWPDVVRLLDEGDDHPIRIIALRAIADQHDIAIVDGLIDRLATEDNASHRRQYADALTRVHRKPAEWTYWGYRPGPRPANTVDWERTEVIAEALNRILADLNLDVRADTLRRMQREEVPVLSSTILAWLKQERDTERVGAILDSLAKFEANETRNALENLIRQAEHSDENRKRALALFTAGLNENSQTRLLDIVQRLEDGPVLAEALSELAVRGKLDSQALLLAKLDSASAEVRAAALDALAALQIESAAPRVPALLGDADPRVRRSAALAAGALTIESSTDALLDLTRDDDPEVRRASLVALRQLREPSAVDAAVKGLVHAATQFAALGYLADYGAAGQIEAVEQAAANSRSTDILGATVRMLTKLENKGVNEAGDAIARVHGDGGVLLRWRVAGPLPTAEAAKRMEQFLESGGRLDNAYSLLAQGTESRVELGAVDAAPKAPVWLAATEIWSAEPTRVQLLASGSGALEVWLNGERIHRRAKPGEFQIDSELFETQLEKGMNRLLMRVEATKDDATNAEALLHARFRRLSSSAEHERLTRYALQNAGNPDRGREVFANLEKSQCLKCHRLEGEGGGVGPELTGIGSRFARIHLIESILEPSRTLAPSYETISVALDNGRVVSGVRIAEDDDTLTLGDEQGKLHEIAKSDIDERIVQPRSTMPDGLEKKLSDREFLDLIAYLVSRKKP